MTDKTDSTAKREEVSISEKRLYALLAATSDVVYRLTPDWGTLYQMQGRGFLSDFPEPSTDWLTTNVHPEEIPRVRIAIEEAIRNKSVFEMEHRVLRLDRSTGWTFSRALPIFDDKGEIIEWFGAASDITARKEAEENATKARASENNNKRLYEAVIDNTPDLMYLFSLDYRFIYANAALLTMWGKNEDEYFRLGLRELGYEPWHADMHEREIDQVVATKQSIRGEVSFPHAVLGKRVYDYIFSPVIDINGEVVAIAGTTRDISEAKLAEEELKRSGEKLEQLVQERTRELKRSNDDLLQFAHVASHDLKEPVRKVRTFAGMLADELTAGPSENADMYLRKIDHAAARMSSMIEGVLHYSTHDHQQQAVAEVNLNDVFQNIETDLEIAIQRQNARIQYTELPVVTGMPVLLYQLFYNLVNNSLKFARQNVKPLIALSSEQIKKEGIDYWLIRLQDNGIGFAEEFSEQIFAAFTRLNPKDHYEGTGLGLALCKKIVERHNGFISAHAVPDEGASFEILLPA